MAHLVSVSLIRIDLSLTEGFSLFNDAVAVRYLDRGINPVLMCPSHREPVVVDVRVAAA